MSRRSRICRRSKPLKSITTISKICSLELRRPATMLSKCMWAAAVALFATSLAARQADQVAGAEKERNAQQQKSDAKQKEKAAPDLASLLGGPKLDQAAVERGRKLF